MPRTLSSTIKAVLAADSGESHDVCIITLPASLGDSTLILYCASANNITIAGQAYQNVLRGISQIKFSIGANTDQATIQLENVSLTIGQTVTDDSRTLDGSRVEIKRAYRIADGTLEAITLFNGVVQGVNVDENVVTLTVVSDFTQRNAMVASRQMTQRCLWRFNTNGTGVGPECGWRDPAAGNTLTQGGDPTTCDLIFDSAGGCLGHENQHRFGGVPPLVSNATTSTTTGSVGGGGTGPTDPTGLGGYEDYSLLRKIYDPDISAARLEN